MKDTSSSKPKLIYYYDALCGWCYGFSPVIKRLIKEYKKSIEFELISGGLFTGNRTGYINDIAPYIKAGAYKNVEIRTGKKFGEAFLKKIFTSGKIYLDSLPPSIALSIVKEKKAEQQLEFSEMLLKTTYYYGLNPANINSYIEPALKIGFKKVDFESDMQETKYNKAAKNDFKKFQKSQLPGMPALVLRKNNHEVLISSGYTSLKELKQKLEQALTL